jgi:hypothetical protein
LPWTTLSSAIVVFLAGQFESPLPARRRAVDRHLKVLNLLGPEVLGPVEASDAGPAFARYDILVSLLSLAVAAIGGWLFVWLASRRREPGERKP